MPGRHVFKTLALALLVVVLTATLAFADTVDAGKVRFRSDFKFAGKLYTKGVYQVHVTSDRDDVLILLLQDGEIVLREHAIVQDGKSRRRRAASSVRVDRRDDGRVILSVRHETRRYIVFFDSAG